MQRRNRKPRTTLGALRSRLPAAQHWRFNEHMIREQAREASRTDSLRFWRPRQFGTWVVHPALHLLLVLGSVAPLLLLTFYLWRFMAPHGSSHPSIPFLFFAGTMALPVLLSCIRRMLNPAPSLEERHAWKVLNTLGIRTCTACGYNCRGLSAPVCPECGHSLSDAAPHEPTPTDEPIHR